MADTTIRLTVNGQLQSVQVAPHDTLNALIRDRLGLTGTKKGCGSGKCGACIVIRDGQAVNSCLTPAMDCDGSEITTVEGLAPARDSSAPARTNSAPADDNSAPPHDKLDPLQEAFVRTGAVQCGFCSPGMLMSAKALLMANPRPTRDEIKVALSGNLCRCTGYKKIVDAVETAVQAGKIPAPEQMATIGGRHPRRDSVAHVRGASKFGADIRRPEMVVGKVLRSRYAHARLLRIDTTAAEKMDGVLAVVTGRELPEGYFGVDIHDRLVFARDKVRYRGDAVAAVAAVDEATACRAMDSINVTYEPIQPVFDAKEAMKADAPVIHENLTDYTIGFETEKRGNICTVAGVCVGDVEAGFAAADVVLEDRFETQIQHQASIETHAATAEVDEQGHITVWTTTQKPFAMRRYLAQALQLPINTIRIKGTAIGGGFGGKLELLVEPYAAVLARKCGRPVQIVYRRDEEFLATTPRHKTYFRVKSGVNRDGTLVARQAEYIYDTGAYSGNGPTTVTLSSQLCGGLYRIPNLLLEGYCVYTNKMNCGSMRGPSGPQTTFAIESHTDNLAHRIGMDPLQFRLKNLLRCGEKTAVGQELVDVDYHAVVEKAAAAADWQRISTGPGRGKGMALVFWLSGGWSTSATVSINEDGTVTLVTGAVDMGTGYLYTSVPQMVAHELGIRPRDVHLVTGDTDQTTYDHGIGGSRGAFTIGRVAQMAAREAKRELLSAAGAMLGREVADLDIRSGRIYATTEPEVGIGVAEVAYARHLKFGGPLAGTATFLPEMDPIDSSRVKGLSFSAFKGNTIGCHIAVAEVEERTGRVEIKQYVAAHDVGKAINPMAVEGQIEGGVSMGLGFALTESVEIGAEGQVLNPDFADYKLPTTLDVPETEAIAVEIPCGYGPHGAKGLGEPTMAPPAAAIANAIFDATGVRLHSTPMTPEKIVAAAQEQKGADG